MKNLLLALCLFMTACANTQTTQNVPIRVTGTGSTQEQALKNAFREAVQIKVGSAILGARETVNDKLTKDEVANYSAGYVDDYKIINTETTSSMTKVTVDVWVRHSDMAMHKTNFGKDEKSFNGDRLDAQYDTIKTQRNDANMVYEKIVNDFPSKAFDLKFGLPNPIVHPNNELVFEIPYQMSWNQAYLKSMREALSIVGDRKRMSQAKIEVRTEGRFIDTISSFYFPDNSKQAMLVKRLNELQIRVFMYDEFNKLVLTQCFKPFYAGGKLWNEHGGDQLGYNDIHLQGQNSIYDKHYINVTNVRVKNIRNIKMTPELVRNCA